MHIIHKYNIWYGVGNPTQRACHHQDQYFPDPKTPGFPTVTATEKGEPPKYTLPCQFIGDSWDVWMLHETSGVKPNLPRKKGVDSSSQQSTRKTAGFSTWSNWTDLIKRIKSEPSSKQMKSSGHLPNFQGITFLHLRVTKKKNDSWQSSLVFFLGGPFAQP